MILISVFSGRYKVITQLTEYYLLINLLKYNFKGYFTILHHLKI